MINVLIICLCPNFCHVSNLIKFEITGVSNKLQALPPFSNCLQPPQCFLAGGFCQSCDASEAASCTEVLLWTGHNHKGVLCSGVCQQVEGDTPVLSWAQTASCEENSVSVSQVRELDVMREKKKCISHKYYIQCNIFTMNCKNCMFWIPPTVQPSMICII